MLSLRGSNALSVFRSKKLLTKCQSIVPEISGIQAQYVHFVNLNNASAHDLSGKLLGCGAVDSCLANTGPFNNLIPDNYWSDVEVEITPTFAWSFNTQHGIQTLYDAKPNLFYGWAVHSGDIAVVPVPATVYLLGSALFGLFVSTRKKIAIRL